jgi:hypothetical protein
MNSAGLIVGGCGRGGGGMIFFKKIAHVMPFKLRQRRNARAFCLSVRPECALAQVEGWILGVRNSRPLSLACCDSVATGAVSLN